MNIIFYYNNKMNNISINLLNYFIIPKNSKKIFKIHIEYINKKKYN